MQKIKIMQLNINVYDTTAEHLALIKANEDIILHKIAELEEVNGFCWEAFKVSDGKIWATGIDEDLGHNESCPVLTIGA